MCHEAITKVLPNHIMRRRCSTFGKIPEMNAPRNEPPTSSEAPS